VQIAGARPREGRMHGRVRKNAIPPPPAVLPPNAAKE